MGRCSFKWTINSSGFCLPAMRRIGNEVA